MDADGPPNVEYIVITTIRKNNIQKYIVKNI